MGLGREVARAPNPGASKDSRSSYSSEKNYGQIIDTVKILTKLFATIIR